MPGPPPPPGQGPPPDGPPGPPEKMKSLILILLGVASWDYVTSLWFEYRLITRKTRFRWQFVPYFMARYFAIGFIITNTVGRILPPQSTCVEAAFSNAVFFMGLLTLVFGTWNLLTRTAIIWSNHTVVKRALIAVGVLHLALALIVPAIKRPHCIPVQPSSVSVEIFGSATATIELGILLLTLVGIRRASKHSGESDLSRLLRTQGVAYFVIVFFIQLSTIASGFNTLGIHIHSYLGLKIVSATSKDPFTRAWVGITGALMGPILSCRLVTSTLVQCTHQECTSEARVRRLDFELSERQSRDGSVGRITTCIEIDTSKDESIC